MLFHSCLYQVHKYIKKIKRRKEIKRKRKKTPLEELACNCSRWPSACSSYACFSWATSFPLFWAGIITVDRNHPAEPLQMTL